MERTSLPPGQRPIDGFPRFGVGLGAPPPAVPDDPRLEIGGPAVEARSLPLAALGDLPRREVVAGLHCVAGWSATALRWAGVRFADVYERLVVPRLAAAVTHVAFEGLDGYRSVACLEDLLADDVLLADGLDGRPLDGDHGAPLRLVSPAQYGFVSTKHLCRIELYASEPPPRYHPHPAVQAQLMAVRPHPRARVAREERHRYLPGWALRPLYRALVPVIRRRG